MAQRAVGDGQCAQVVIPVVASRFHVDLVAGALDHDDIFHARTALERFVHHGLEFHYFAVDERPVAGDHHLGLAVLDAPLQGIHGEAAEHHRVDRAQLGAGQHRKDDLRDARQVDGHPVAFDHAHGLEQIREAGHLAVEGVIGEGAVELAVLALPDEGQLVLAVGLQVAVHRVVDDVDLGPHEPLVERLL